MEKKGTEASPAMAFASSVLPGAGRSLQKNALGNMAAKPAEFFRMFEKIDDFLEVLPVLRQYLPHHQR